MQELLTSLLRMLPSPSIMPSAWQVQWLMIPGSATRVRLIWCSQGKKQAKEWGERHSLDTSTTSILCSYRAREVELREDLTVLFRGNRARGAASCARLKPKS
jgi:hypothetical protein